MFSQTFGHYLLNRNLITSEQLLNTLEAQKSVQVKFGVLAVDKGYMSPIQVETVHEKQKQVDKRFGEIAVELGYLTEEQVESLISEQKQGYLAFAQCLVDQNIMTIEQFSQALNDYKKDNQLSDEQLEAFKNENVEAFVQSLLSYNPEAQEKYGDYISLFVKNCIRFIDKEIYLEIDENSAVDEDHWFVYQTIEGDAPLFTAIRANDASLLYLSSKYAEEPLTEVDELAKDAVKEFLNLHNGIHLVNMSNNGVELSLNPQHIVNSPKVSGDFLVIKITIANNQFQLLLSPNVNDVTIG